MSEVNFSVKPQIKGIPEGYKPCKNFSFRGGELERTPSKDSFDLKDKAKKAGLVALIVAAGAAIVDFTFCKGKHIKNIFSKASKEQEELVSEVKKPDIVDITKPEKTEDSEIARKVEEYFIAEEKASKELKEQIAKSDALNEKWLEEQHNLKEKEYSKFWNDALTEQEANKIRTIQTEKGSEVWQGKHKLSETFKDENNWDVTVNYDLNGNKLSQISTKDKFAKELVLFDEVTGKEKINYFKGFGGLTITKFDNTGENVVSRLTIPSVKFEKFDEAVKLSQKYDLLSKTELEKLYKEALSGNSNNISEFEFNILEGHLDLAHADFPKTSSATQLKEHHDINGSNHIYRDNPEKPIGNGKKQDDYTDEEWQKLSKEEKKIAYKNELYSQMKKLDKEFKTLPPLEKDCVFYRGLCAKYIPSVIDGKVGDVVIPDKGYAYAAFERNVANSFGDGTVLAIRVPKGSKISRNMEHGGEAVFPRNSEYKILSKAKTPGGKWRIELEYILPKEV